MFSGGLSCILFINIKSPPREIVTFFHEFGLEKTLIEDHSNTLFDIFQYFWTLLITGQHVLNSFSTFNKKSCSPFQLLLNTRAALRSVWAACVQFKKTFKIFFAKQHALVKLYFVMRKYSPHTTQKKRGIRAVFWWSESPRLCLELYKTNVKKTRLRSSGKARIPQSDFCV